MITPLTFYDDYDDGWGGVHMPGETVHFVHNTAMSQTVNMDIKAPCVDMC